MRSNRAAPRELMVEALAAALFLGCAVPLTRGGYDRACTEGPVYAAADVDWQALPSHLSYAVSA